MLAIGNVIDTQEEYPDTVVASALWHFEPTLAAAVARVRDGTFAAEDFGVYSFMKHEGASLAPLGTFEGQVPEPLLRFLLVVVEKRRQTLLPEIAEEYGRRVDELRGRARAHVVLAREADQSAVRTAIERAASGTPPHPASARPCAAHWKASTPPSSAPAKWCARSSWANRVRTWPG